MPQRAQFQKIQARLVRELEKKFSGKHVVFIGDRRILPKPTRKTRTKSNQKRPRRYIWLKKNKYIMYSSLRVTNVYLIDTYSV